MAGIISYGASNFIDSNIVHFADPPEKTMGSHRCLLHIQLVSRAMRSNPLISYFYGRGERI